MNDKNQVSYKNAQPMLGEIITKNVKGLHFIKFKLSKLFIIKFRLTKY